MFTGIVTDIGRIIAATDLDKGLRLRIATNYNVHDIAIGASIACAGVCLTVTQTSAFGSEANGVGHHEDPHWFEVEAWEEALRLTTVKTWQIGTKINLERSLKLGDEMGGHLVSGHVDGVAHIAEKKEEGEAIRFTVDVPGRLAPFIAEKGSVALDGTSLTVNTVCGNNFDVLIIRHTNAVTTWGQRATGDSVNIEVDQMARYAARLISLRDSHGEDATSSVNDPQQ